MVKDIVAQIARYAEGESLYIAIKNGQDKTDEQVKAKLDVILACYNAVIYDVATNYYDYVKKVEVPVETLNISNFDEPIIKIVNIQDGYGKKINYSVEGDVITVEKSTFTFVYQTIPKVQTMNESYVFKYSAIGKNVIIYGALAEYCLIQNRIEEAQNWESKYRQAIEVRRDYKKRRLKAGKKWGL